MESMVANLRNSWVFGGSVPFTRVLFIANCVLWSVDLILWIMVICDMIQMSCKERKWIVGDTNGLTPLHEAARCGKLGCVPVEILKKYIVIQDKDGWTPLHAAALSRRLSDVPSSCLTSENMTVKDKYGETPLHYAVKQGQLELVLEEVLTVENISIGDNAGVTPLHWAALGGRLSQLPEAVLTPANLLIENASGESPVYYAVAGYTLEVFPLGLKFPESVREVVGDEWWEKNQAVLRDKHKLDLIEEDGMGLDLF